MKFHTFHFLFFFSALLRLQSAQDAATVGTHTGGGFVRSRSWGVGAWRRRGRVLPAELPGRRQHCAAHLGAQRWMALRSERANWPVSSITRNNAVKSELLQSTEWLEDIVMF